jgi:hypothetical protein
MTRHAAIGVGVARAVVLTSLRRDAPTVAQLQVVTAHLGRDLPLHAAVVRCREVLYGK